MKLLNKEFKVTWYHAAENRLGIKTVAIKNGFNRYASGIMGYNDILKGDQVRYKGEDYTVVKVLEQGKVKLSQIVSPAHTEVVKIKYVTKQD